MGALFRSVLTFLSGQKNVENQTFLIKAQQIRAVFWFGFERNLFESKTDPSADSAFGMTITLSVVL
jgi:hypothetical protein